MVSRAPISSHALILSESKSVVMQVHFPTALSTCNRQLRAISWQLVNGLVSRILTRLLVIFIAFFLGQVGSAKAKHPFC